MTQVAFRVAVREDLDDLVRMLADDALGSTRESAGPELDRAYLDAFEAIDRDPNNALIVACVESKIVGQMQLTWIPNLNHRGGWRAQIEGVRVDRAWRGRGLGRQMFEWAIERARERGCLMVQLTSNRERASALQFYASLGFEASHVGFKRYLT